MYAQFRPHSSRSHWQVTRRRLQTIKVFDGFMSQIEDVVLNTDQVSAQLQDVIAIAKMMLGRDENQTLFHDSVFRNLI
jgi:hypothetical protein